MSKQNEYRGYGLFNDVEDKEVQTFNRARIMVNIMEDHSSEGNVNAAGAALCIGYFRSLPEEDRQAVHQKTAAILLEKGLRKL